MVLLAPLRRLIAGPDQRVPLRLRPAYLLYGIPLGLLAVLGMTIGSARYLSDTRHLSDLNAGLLAVLGLAPLVAAVAGRPLLAWRLAYPMLYLGVLAARPQESWPWSPLQILAFLVTFAILMLREDSGVIGWALALTVIPIFAYAPRANAWGATVLFVVLALAGDVLSRRRRSSARLAEQAELTELEQARRAVLEERTRIAREMHDVVAHHMSMIAVQAETAPYRVTGLPEPALAEFRSIAAASRAALIDMRRLLGVLRAETEESPRAPQPGLGDLPALVETVARAGLVVTFPQAAALPEGVREAAGLAAYRIVQEALANAARHAPGGPVQVSVRGLSGVLLVEIRNGPAASAGQHVDARSLPSPLARPSAGKMGSAGGTHGHGLAGMRERAAALGGSLDAGPEADGGFLVAARLPLAEEDAEFAARPVRHAPRPTAPAELTPRETEVLRLIARGRSNQEIAADLVVAEQTIKTHVGRILAKLGLRDRAQVVVFAYESGLVAAGE
jgi:signal transduction histidine kinase/DNA-binding CsgD family transcriptional regulator